MSLRSAPLKRSIAFYEGLRTMAKAGVPITRTLSTIARNVTAGWRPVVNGLEKNVLEGKPLHEGMALYPGIFTPLEQALVKAGETGGRIEESLEQILRIQKRQLEMRNQVVVALIYPAILVHAAILLPPLIEWVQRGPLAYARAIALPLVILWGAVGGLFLFDSLVRAGGPIASLWDSLKIHLPWFGGLFARSALSRFTRCLSALHRSAVPLLLSIDTATAATGNDAIRHRLRSITPGVQGGKTLAEALAATGAYPHEALVILETGEQSGAMDVCLERVADALDDDIHHSLQKIAKVLPVVFLLIAIGYGVYQLLGMLAGIFAQTEMHLPH